MQFGGQLQRVGAGPGAAAFHGHRGQRVQAAAPGEHARPPEYPGQGGAQQLIAPPDGVAEGLLAPRPARIGGGQAQALPEPAAQRFGREQLGPRGGQLDRERQPVQPGADRGDVRGVGVGDRETRPGHLRLLGEQYRRTAGRHLRGAVAGRNGQRRHRQLVFALHVQRPPGCCQDHQFRCGRQQRGHHRGGAVQLLEVVQHQQGLALLQVPGHHVGVRSVAGHVQAGGDRLPYHLAVANRSQRDEVAAVRERIVQQGGGGQGKPGLADAARAGQRHQPDVRAGDGGAQRRQLGIAAYQRRHRCREARPGAQAPQWRELLLQTGDHQLVKTFRRLNVLEPVPAQVTQGHTGGQPRFRQVPRRVRQHHLAAVRSRRDPGGPVHVQPEVTVLVADRLTRVQAHPDPDPDAIRPVVGGKSALPGHAGADRVAGRLEYDEKAVTLGPQIPAAATVEGVAQQGALSRQRLPVTVT